MEVNMDQDDSNPHIGSPSPPPSPPPPSPTSVTPSVTSPVVTAFLSSQSPPSKHVTQTQTPQRLESVSEYQPAALPISMAEPPPPPSSPLQQISATPDQGDASSYQFSELAVTSSHVSHIQSLEPKKVKSLSFLEHLDSSSSQPACSSAALGLIPQHDSPSSPKAPPPPSPQSSPRLSPLPLARTSDSDSVAFLALPPTSSHPIAFPTLAPFSLSSTTINLQPLESAPSPKRRRTELSQHVGLVLSSIVPIPAIPALTADTAIVSHICVPDAGPVSPQTPDSNPPEVSLIETRGVLDEPQAEPTPSIYLPSEQLPQSIAAQAPNHYQTDVLNVEVSKPLIINATEQPNVISQPDSDIAVSLLDDEITGLYLSTHGPQASTDRNEPPEVRKHQASNEMALESCVVPYKCTAVLSIDTLSSPSNHTQLGHQSSKEGFVRSLSRSSSMAEDCVNGQPNSTSDDKQGHARTNNEAGPSSYSARRNLSVVSPVRVTGKRKYSTDQDISDGEAFSSVDKKQAGVEPKCLSIAAASTAELARNSVVQTTSASKPECIGQENKENKAANLSPSTPCSVPDSERRKRAKNYFKIRYNLRMAMEKKDYMKVPYIIRNKALQSEPEPDTLDLLADCLKSMGNASWEKYRTQASKLRNDPLYGDGGLPMPLEELSRAIGNASGDFDDFDLITSPDRSAPIIRPPFSKEVRQSDGSIENYFVLILTIQLDLCPGLVIDGVTEVVAEVSEPCDEEALPEERKRKEERLRHRAAETALNRLIDLVERSHAIRQQLKDSSDLEDHGSISPVAELRNLISNASGAFELILSRKRSMPRVRTVGEGTGEIKVAVRVDLDVSDWLDFDLPIRLSSEVRRKLPLRMLPEIRKKKINAIMNESASNVLSEVKETAAKVVVHAKNKLKKDVRNLLKDWAVMNENPTYVRTLKCVQKIVCSEKGANNYGFKLNCFGSMACELALPGSDLDINITPVSEKILKFVTEQDEDESNGSQEFKYTDEMKLGILRHLEPIMTKNGMKQVHLIHARVPLLRFVDPDTDIEVDLTVGNPNGVLLTKLLRYHVRVDKRVWELSMLIRYWAKQRKISGVVNGFINPLGWTVMVIYFLQHKAFPPIARLFTVLKPNAERVARDVQIIPKRWDSSSKCGANETPIEQLMVDFFRFYKEFNFEENVISINLQEPAKKSEFKAKELTERGPITIEQPLMPGKNIVGYVAKGSLIETRAQMDIAIFRALNIGKASAVFRSTRNAV